MIGRVIHAANIRQCFGRVNGRGTAINMKNIDQKTGKIPGFRRTRPAFFPEQGGDIAQRPRPHPAAGPCRRDPLRAAHVR
jgi:hypothetical protein